MTSSLANSVLFVALIMTSLLVATMYRKLKAFETHHRQFGESLARTGQALAEAQTAIAGLNGEGRSTLVELGERIESAKMLVREIDARTAKSSH